MLLSSVKSMVTVSLVSCSGGTSALNTYEPALEYRSDPSFCGPTEAAGEASRLLNHDVRYIDRKLRVAPR